MIRAMRATDAVAVRALTRGGDSWELTALNWPKSPPESKSPNPLGLLVKGLVPTASVVRIGLAPKDGRIQGVVIARARASGLVWDVEHLVSSGSLDVAVELLRWACNQALSEKGRRVFLETPEDGPGVEAAGRSGFERCTHGTSWFLGPGFTFDKNDTVPARPRLRSDEMGLFQLYNAVVPAPVRSAEAINYQEWAALHRGRRVWAPSLMGSGQDYVWEMGSRPVGWMRIEFGERAQCLRLLIHPQAEAFAERMARDALGQLSNKVPVVAEVREYQTVAQHALETVGFQRGHEYIVWVRQMAQRVTEPALAAVRAQPSPLA